MQEDIIQGNSLGEVPVKEAASSELEKKYEALVIISCKDGGDGVSAIIEKLKKLIEGSAKLGSVDEWGRKKLAYPINKENEAYYVLFTFTSSSEFPAEFIRICRITDGVVRAMVTKLIVKKSRKASVRSMRKQQASEGFSEPAGVDDELKENLTAPSSESSVGEVEGQKDA